MSSSKKILLVYGVPRSGHAQAAHALREELERCGYEVREHHLLVRWPRLGKIAPWVYRVLIRRASPLWGHMHGNRHYAGLMRFVVRVSARFDLMGMRALLRDWSPDRIVVSHFFPLLLLAEDKRRHRLTIPLYAIGTDFGLHRYWADTMVDRYFVAHEAAKHDLVKAGITERRIVITGIPIRAAFGTLPTQAEARHRLGIDAHRPVVLVMGGSYGFFPFLDVLAFVLKHHLYRHVQWLFLFGGNADDLRDARAMIDEDIASCIFLFGFRDDMPVCMTAADIALSKAGGITTSELLATHLPSVIYRPLPGQERTNVGILSQGGAAMVARSVHQAMRLIKEMLASSERRAAYRRAAEHLAHPWAAAEIVREIDASWQRGS